MCCFHRTFQQDEVFPEQCFRAPLAGWSTVGGFILSVASFAYFEFLFLSLFSVRDGLYQLFHSIRYFLDICFFFPYRYRYRYFPHSNCVFDVNASTLRNWTKFTPYLWPRAQRRLEHVNFRGIHSMRLQWICNSVTMLMCITTYLILRVDYYITKKMTCHQCGMLVRFLGDFHESANQNRKMRRLKNIKTSVFQASIDTFLRNPGIESIEYFASVSAHPYLPCHSDKHPRPPVLCLSLYPLP